jgi:hypothetical protein
MYRITAHSTDDHRERGLCVNSFPFLHSPFRFSSLLSVHFLLSFPSSVDLLAHVPCRPTTIRKHRLHTTHPTPGGTSAMIQPRMIDWLPISSTFPSFSQITFQSLLDTMRNIIDFIFTPLIDFVPSIDIINVYLRMTAKTMLLQIFIIVHRLLNRLREIGERYTPTDPRYYMGKCEMGSIGRLILLGCEIGIGMLVLGDVMAYYSRSAVHSIPAEYSTPKTAVSTEHATTNHDSRVSVLEPRISQEISSSYNSGTSSKFSSTSTKRTNSTTTTTTTAKGNATPDDYQGQTISPVQNENQVRLPPQLVLRQYIYPKYSSTWPAYYLQAFHKAQESLTKEGNIHVDAPTSSGTRNNKDGCVGKIVLDRRVVKRDVKEGVVGYCEGVSGTVSLMMFERFWLMNRVIGRALYGNRGSYLRRGS